jgi:hypothetical protein
VVTSFKNLNEAQYWASQKEGETFVFRGKVDINNPKFYDLFEPDSQSEFDRKMTPRYLGIEKLKQQGFDALVIKLDPDFDNQFGWDIYGGYQVIVFDPTNIILVDDALIHPSQEVLIKEGSLAINI